MHMRTKFYLFLLLLFLPASFLLGQMVQGGDTLVGNEWIRYGQTYYRFSIQEDGIYRISSADLQEAGIDLGQVSGSEVRIYSMGRQVPIYVTTTSVFADADYIEFFGYRNRGEMDRYLYRYPDADMLNPEHSLFTEGRPYYLSLEGVDPPRRVTSLTNNVINPPAVAPYVLYEEKILYTATLHDPYFQVNDGGAVSYSSFMHGEGFSNGLEPNHLATLPATQVAASGPDAQLQIRFVTSNYTDHTLPITWNDQPLGVINSRNIRIIDTTFMVPLSLIQSSNQLRINSGNALSRFAMVSVTLTYPRLLSAPGATQLKMQLATTSGDQYGVIDGFDHHDVPPIVYSTDGRTRLVAALNGNNQVHFLWPGASTDAEVLLIAPDSEIHQVENLEPRNFTDLSGDDTEYVIITHPDLMEPGTGSEYIQYRSSAEGGSFRAKAYSILDLYDQFGYGIQKHPQAIRNFVEFMHRHWPSAKMILIVGRGIEYNRSRYPDPSWEPSFFVPTFGRPGADNLLAATLWDLVPRYPIGRLAVVNPQTLHEYLMKAREHDLATNTEQTQEAKAWIKNVIHIAGGMTSQEQSDFKFTLNSLAEDLAASDFGAKVYHFQKESSDIIGESQSKQIAKLLKEGSSVINYLGHSSTSTFEYNIIDPTQWNNKGHYPIFSGMGCSAGQIHGTIMSLSDRYVLIPEQGAIAFISGSGSQFAGALVTWARPWYEYFGNLAYGTTLGESVRYGLKGVAGYVDPSLNSFNHYRFLLEQQTTQGDPALRLNPLPGPDYVIDPNSIVVGPATLNTKLDSFDLSFSIVNIGRNLRQHVDYTISLRDANGSLSELLQSTEMADQFESIVQLKLPLAVNGNPGIYRLLIEVDPQNTLEELPAPLAELNNYLEDNLGVEGIALVVVDNIITPAYPTDFAIVNQSPPQLVATSSNSFIHKTNIVMELDTNGLFNSPFRIRETFSGHGGTVKWSPNIQLLEGQEYFWRVSTDSLSPEQGYNWKRRSFTYLSGHSEGWSQSHFHQLTDDQLEQIVPDSNAHTFRFDRKSTNYTVLNRFHDVPMGLVPYFFQDGKFNAKLAQTFRNLDVQGFVVAIDSTTGQYLMNPPGGLYGSVGLAIPMEGFAYNLTQPENRQNLINLVEHVIPEGYYVFFYTYQHTGFETYHPEEWAADEVQFGKSIFSIIENQYAGSDIRSLADKGSVPYIVLFQKGKKGIEEKIAADVEDIISVSFDGGSFFTKGNYLSTLIGPASAWGSIEQQIKTFNDTSGTAILSAWAMNSTLTDTFWISHDISSPSFDISQVDAQAYPYVQMKLETVDSTTYRPSQIEYWRVLYAGFPEFIIHPDLGFEFNDDTLYQGEEMRLRTYVENLSPYAVDSLPVSLRVISESNQTHELRQTLEPVNAKEAIEIIFTRNTVDLEGPYQVVLEINPGRVVPEQVLTNNIGILSMYVIHEEVNPILDVTFDGAHIRDGDLVAAKPEIRIALHDESPYLRLEDTTTFEVYLQFPSEPGFTRIPFASGVMEFIPASVSGKNEAVANLRPNLSEDGIYRLQVKAKDASGNVAGDQDYLVSFRVIHAESISHIYNFPNPFNTATRFGYTLTGEGSPAFYKIQIVSVNGIVVREISQEELGPLVVGTHFTSYAWDGGDADGSPLPSGLYFYRMITQNGQQQDYPRYETLGDALFKNGWGKLIILR